MKKLLFITVMSMLTAGFAYAETANVNVYGTINTSIESAKATSPTVGEAWTGRLRSVSNSTNVGIKGAEDLGNDLKGVFQVELDVRVPEAALGTALRNSMIGLQGNWGTAFIGKWDTPFKTSTGFMEPFYNTSAAYLANIGDTIGGAGGTSSFNVRQSNSINYWSPKFAGVSANLMYAPKGNGYTASDYLMSGSLNYADGPINAAFAYEKHNDFIAVGQTDTGMKLAAGYKLFDATSLNAAWDQISQKNAAGVTTKRTALLFSLIQKLDDFAIRAGYGLAGKVNRDGTEVADTGATQMMFGGSYSLSKRTDLYAMFTKINNDPAIGYNFIVNPVGAGSPAALPGAGSDPQTIGLGVRHTF